VIVPGSFGFRFDMDTSQDAGAIYRQVNKAKTLTCLPFGQDLNNPQDATSIIGL